MGAWHRFRILSGPSCVQLSLAARDARGRCEVHRLDAAVPVGATASQRARRTYSSSGTFSEYLETSAEAWMARMIAPELIAAHSKYLAAQREDRHFIPEC